MKLTFLFGMLARLPFVFYVMLWGIGPLFLSPLADIYGRVSTAVEITLIMGRNAYPDAHFSFRRLSFCPASDYGPFGTSVLLVQIILQPLL